MIIIIIIIKYYFSFTLGYDGTFWESIVQWFSQTNRNTNDSLTEECLLDSAKVLVGSMIENAELQMCSDQDM